MPASASDATSAVPGARLELETTMREGAAPGATDDAAIPATPARVHVTLVTFADGVRLLVSDAVSAAGGLEARRRVSLLLVPDTLPAAARDTSASGGGADTTSRLTPTVAPVTTPGVRLVPLRERAWAQLP